MKLKGWCGGIGFLTALLVFALGLFSVSASAAFLYKSYVIRKAGGQDILCDPYIVQKDDYVLKIFRQRGEISHADFPDFLNIFKLVNPQVEDINRVLPGQRIFIPLKKLEPGSVPDQERGVVTIPFITQTEIGDILKNHAAVYEVVPGDTVSKLLAAHFGRYGTKSYNEAMNMFKAMNPQVEDVDLILVGQMLWLPKETIQNELWYESLFDAAGNLAMTPPTEVVKAQDKPEPQQTADELEALAAAELEKLAAAEAERLAAAEAERLAAAEAERLAAAEGERLAAAEAERLAAAEAERLAAAEAERLAAAEAEETAVAGIQGLTGDPVMDAASITALEEAAGLLDARLYQKGTYYFPRPGLSDLQLDLARFPVLETRDGARVLIVSSTDGGTPSPEMLSVLKNYWKDLVVADLPKGSDLPLALDVIVDSLAGGSISEKRVLTDAGVRVTFEPRWMLDTPGKTGVDLAIIPIKDMGEKTSPPVLDYIKTLGVELKEVVLSGTSGSAETGVSTRVSYGQVPLLDGSLDRQAFVRNFFGILGLNYQQNATVSFKYAGIQIQAVTNALNRPDGHLVLIDFNDLQEEAVTTLEKAGFEMVRVPSSGPLADLIPELLRAADMTCETDPTFNGGGQPGSDNVTLFLPGFLALKDEIPQALLATVPVHDDLVRFFMERQIDVVALTNVPERQTAEE